jgi:hypothetical protein
MASQVDHGKQQIADLHRRLAAVARGDFGFDLIAFLTNLGQNGQGIVPVEANPAGLDLKFQRPGEGGHCHRHAG